MYTETPCTGKNKRNQESPNVPGNTHPATLKKHVLLCFIKPIWGIDKVKEFACE